MRGLNAKLKALGDAVKARYPNINYGGCCVYASAVAKRLEELGVKVDVCVPDYADVATVEDARNNLQRNGVLGVCAREWAEAGISFNHVAVRYRNGFRWYTHDTDATHTGRDGFGCSDWRPNEPRYTALPDGMTPDEAWTISDDPRGWNSTFKREHIPAIRQMVREALQ